MKPYHLDAKIKSAFLLKSYILTQHK